MLGFIKGVYRIFRCIRECVMNLFFILFVMLSFSIIAFFTGNEKSTAEDPLFIEGALRLNLDGYLADNHDEFGQLYRYLQSELSENRQPIKISTFDVVRAIMKAQSDPQITGLVLDLAYFDGGDIPSLTAVGEAINKFKQSNKPVIAIGEAYTQKQYYLASFADKIYLNKAGFVDLHGLNYSTLYFKQLLDKIEAVPHIFRVGTYKSAVEPFIRNDMSPEARQNAQLWLTTLWKNFSHQIAKNRAIETNNLIPPPEQYIQQYKEVKGDDAQYALKQGWVSAIMTTPQMRDQLINTFGKNSQGNYKHIDYFDYVENLSDRFNVSAEQKIAVINVEGSIMLGESDDNIAGSETIVKLLHQASEDDHIFGVILRINSPGGSAMASELIRQEVDNLQQKGKPVVASMGGLAASGGYWIAATSDKIIASPTTLTGSIGIFGLAVTFEKTAKNLGVNEDGVITSPLAQQTALKTLSKEQGEIIQISIENGYDRFLELVSRGRKMPKEQVDKIAQGQVWLGETALEKGLVDQLGDINEAYNQVIALVNQKRTEQGLEPLTHFKIQWLIDQKNDFISQFARDFKMKMAIKGFNWFELPFLKQTSQQWGQLLQFNDPKNSYLYCLNCGTIK